MTSHFVSKLLFWWLVVICTHTSCKRRVSMQNIRILLYLIIYFVVFRTVGYVKKPSSIEYFFERIFVKYRKQGNILYITYNWYNFLEGGGLVFIYSKKQTLIKIYICISKLNLVGRQYDVIYIYIYTFQIYICLFIPTSWSKRAPDSPFIWLMHALECQDLKCLQIQTIPKINQGLRMITTNA